MARVVPNGKQVDEQYAWTSWLLAYENGLKEVKAQCRAAGILGDMSTGTPDFKIPLPPLGSGEDVTGADGNEWLTNDPRTYFISGLAYKQGMKGLRFRERDLFENYVQARRMNAMAYGRTEVLYEDRRTAECLQLGFEQNVMTEEGIADLRGPDDRPIFGVMHPFDFIKKQTGRGHEFANTFPLALTPDNVLHIRDNFAGILDEVGNPVFSDMELEFVLIFPAKLKTDAEKCLNREFIGEFQSFGGASVNNIAYKMARPLCLRQLRDPSRWYLVIINQPMRPVIRVGLQPFKRIEIGPNSDMWRTKQIMKWFSYERATYRMVDPRLVATSKRAA